MGRGSLEPVGPAGPGPEGKGDPDGMPERDPVGTGPEGERPPDGKPVESGVPEGPGSLSCPVGSSPSDPLQLPPLPLPSPLPPGALSVGRPLGKPEDNPVGRPVGKPPGKDPVGKGSVAVPLPLLNWGAARAVVARTRVTRENLILMTVGAYLVV